jgi:hypothetical protein
MLVSLAVVACGSDSSSSSSGSGAGTSTGATGGSAATGGGGGTASGSASGTASGGGGTPSGGAGGGSPTTCGDMGLICMPGDICVQTIVTAGPMNTITYACEADPCAPAALDCTCAGMLCGGGGPGSMCSVEMGMLVCQSGGVCAHPDTPIATPSGERRIADLHAGDLVLSEHRGRLVPVPLRRATKTEVRDHAVVELTLSNGRQLRISAGHPTADGRLFADLALGGELDGARIEGIATRAYDAAHTYDILPDSDSGSYVAAGVLIGSTLR